MAKHKDNVSPTSWSELPDFLLRRILSRLSFLGGNLVRVSLVCTSWRKIALEATTCPMLILPPSGTNEAACNLFHFPNHLLDFPLPSSFPGRWICNSWKNWLVTINRAPPFDIKLCNLFSRAEVRLPPPSTFKSTPPPFDQVPVEYFITKIVASSSPLDPDCIFVAIHSFGKLGFCRTGDTKWKSFEFESDKYKDVIYFNGEFFAVGETGNLVVCEFGAEPKTIEIVPMKKITTDEFYLVELSNDLLKVVKILDRKFDYCIDQVKFKLFKLDFGKRRWEAVGNIGENALFLSHNMAISASAEDFPIKGHCIYFIDYRLYLGSNSKSIQNLWVFDLKDQEAKMRNCFVRIWSFPSLWLAPKV